MWCQDARFIEQGVELLAVSLRLFVHGGGGSGAGGQRSVDNLLRLLLHLLAVGIHHDFLLLPQKQLLPSCSSVQNFLTEKKVSLSPKFWSKRGK